MFSRSGSAGTETPTMLGVSSNDRLPLVVFVRVAIVDKLVMCGEHRAV
jgi:hypothetical protein